MSLLGSRSEVISSGAPSGFAGAVAFSDSPAAPSSCGGSSLADPSSWGLSSAAGAAAVVGAAGAETTGTLVTAVAFVPGETAAVVTSGAL